MSKRKDFEPWKDDKGRFKGKMPIKIRKKISGKMSQIMKERWANGIYDNFVGEGHPKWQGGRWKDAYGYIVVYTGVNSRKYEHRVVMEKSLGRKLQKEEFVHHLNGVKDDNRIENLVIVDSSKHEKRTFEKKLQKRIRELEEIINV